MPIDWTKYSDSTNANASGKAAFDWSRYAAQGASPLFSDTGDVLSERSVNLQELLDSLSKQISDPEGDHSNEPFVLPRLTFDKYQRDPSKDITEQLPELAKNILGFPEDIISGLLTLPINLVKDPNGTMGALAKYPNEVINNLINADLFDLGYETSGLSPEEFDSRKEEARNALFADPLGPVNVATMFAGVLKAGGPKAVKSAGKAAKEINTIKTAQTLLGEESGSEWAQFAAENKPGPRSRIVRKAGEMEIPESVDPTIGVTATPEGSVAMESGLPIQKAGGVSPFSNFEQFLQSLRGEGKGVSAIPEEIGSKSFAKGEKKPKVSSDAREVSSLIQQLDEIEGQAKARIEARLKSGTLTAGGLVDIADYAIIGAAKIAKGTIKFGVWAKEMVDEFGDEVKPRLKEIWDASHARLDRMGIKKPKKPVEDLVDAEPFPSRIPLASEFEEGVLKADRQSVIRENVGKGKLSSAVEGMRRFIVDIPETILQDKARVAVMDRASDIQLREHRLGEFGKHMKSAFNEAERNEMPFYRERTNNPLTGKTPEISDAGKKFVDEVIDPYLKKGFDELVDYGLLSEEQYISDFLSHFWEGGGKGTGVSKLAMRVRQGRKIPTIEEGIEMGLKPKFKDMWDYVKTYEDMRIRVIANTELVRKLRGMTDGEGRPTLQTLTNKTRHLIDEGWQVRDTYALNKAMYVSRKGKDGKNVTIQKFPPTLVHPDLVRAVDRVFTETFNPGWMQSIRTINASAKATQLMFSLFHPFTLLESGLGIGITAPFKHKFGLELMKDNAFLEEMYKVGRVQGGIPHDVGASIVRNALLKLESKTSGMPLVSQASTLLRRYNDWFNKKLWDEYQTGMKAYAYWKLKDRMLEKNPNVNPRIVSERVGEFVNNAFGGQNWDAMLTNPHVQDVLHAAMLAPDWTISNIKQGASLFKSSREGALRAKMAGLPEDVVKRVAVNDMLDGQMGRAYWARTGSYSFLALQMLNLIFSEFEDGEPRFTWENPGDHTLDFYIGKNENGQQVYASPQKQTKEVLRWVTDLPHNLGSKASPFVRLAGEQLTGHDVGSGFPAPWAREDEYGIKPNFLESIPQRLLGGAETYVPFSFSGDNFAFTLPVTRGLTAYNFVQQYRRAYLDNNYGQMQRLEVAARANNLQVRKLKSLAKSKVKSGLRKELEN